MNDYFFMLWGQLMLITQFPIYPCEDVPACFDHLEEQVRKAYGEGDQKLSTVQMLALMNSIHVWRDILVKQSTETSEGQSE